MSPWGGSASLTTSPRSRSSCCPTSRDTSRVPTTSSTVASRSNSDHPPRLRAVSSPPVSVASSRASKGATDASLIRACRALIQTFASGEPLPQARTETRARVISAAIQLFGQKGYESTSMKDLAAAAGVKAPALYNHFTSKEAVLVEAVEGALETFFVDVLSPLPDEPVDIWLEQIVKRHTLFQIERIDIASASDLVLAGEHRVS